MSSPDRYIPSAVLASLERSRIFGSLKPDFLRGLAETGHLLQLDRGAYLFRKGDDGDAAFILLEGELEVSSLSKDGRELHIATLTSGELIGEMAVLDDAPRSANVVASRGCRLWRLPRAAVLALLLDNAELALRVLIELCRRVRASNAALELASRRTMGGKLAALLIAEKNRLGFVALTQFEIARRIGSSREQVNRKLRLWRESGWVVVEKSGIQIRQPGPLQDLVG